MEKRTLYLVTATLIAFNMFFILGMSSITGHTVSERATSLFTGNALAGLAPIIILSFILTAGLFVLHDIRKK